MLLITGTQRSGTSLTAEFVRRCGYDIRGPVDSVGKYEDPAITQAFREALGDPQFPFSNFPESMTEPYRGIGLGDINVQVAKFSFMLMNPKFIDLWVAKRNTFKRDRWLILYRPFADVCRSKFEDPERAKVFNNDSLLIPRDTATLRRNWLLSYRKICELQIPHTVLFFPEFTHNYSSLYEALHDFGGLDLVPRDEDLWLNTFEPNKVTIS